MPIPMPVQTPQSSPAAKQTGPTRGEKTSQTETFSSVHEEKKNKTSSPESFLSYMLAGLMGMQTRQTVSVPPTGSHGTGATLATGGTFSLDPSMLILPDSVDSAISAIDPASQGMNFDDMLLAALTPGTPSPVVGMSLDSQGKVAVQFEGDPRLIATGLDPAQMQALVTRLAAQGSQNAAASATGTVAAATPEVATVSFLPDTASPPSSSSAGTQAAPDTSAASSGPASRTAQNAAPPAATASAAAMSARNDIVSMAASSMTPDDAATPATGDDLPAAATLAAASADSVQDGDGQDFDPLEFRLALKTPSSLFGADPYQDVSGDAETPRGAVVSAAAKSSGGLSHAVKGAMGETGGNPLAPLPPASDQAKAVSSSQLVFDAAFAADAQVPAPSMQSASFAANPVLQNVTAAQSHPATQAVAALVQKQAQSGSGSQTLAVQLDPPELGKMQMKMKYQKGEPLRVHIVLEKADTMNMFQRDQQALHSLLNQAGIQTDSSSLTFDLGGQGSFGQALNDQTGGSGQSQPGWTSDAQAGSVDDILETTLSVTVDPRTGLAHYNMMV